MRQNHNSCVYMHKRSISEMKLRTNVQSFSIYMFYRKSRLKVYTTTESVMRLVTTRLDLTIEQLYCGVTANKTSILIGRYVLAHFSAVRSFQVNAS